MNDLDTRELRVLLTANFICDAQPVLDDAVAGASPDPHLTVMAEIAALIERGEHRPSGAVLIQLWTADQAQALAIEAEFRAEQARDIAQGEWDAAERLRGYSRARSYRALAAKCRAIQLVLGHEPDVEHGCIAGLCDDRCVLR